MRDPRRPLLHPGEANRIAPRLRTGHVAQGLDPPASGPSGIAEYSVQRDVPIGDQEPVVSTRLVPVNSQSDLAELLASGPGTFLVGGRIQNDLCDRLPFPTPPQINRRREKMNKSLLAFPVLVLLYGVCDQ